MDTYRVAVSVLRSKLPCIKLIRAITGWGLKDSKDFVEREFSFDEWMSTYAVFDMTIGTHQLAKLAHFCANDDRNNTEIVGTKIIEPAFLDAFDFTSP